MPASSVVRVAHAEESWKKLLAYIYLGTGGTGEISFGTLLQTHVLLLLFHVLLNQRFCSASRLAVAWPEQASAQAWEGDPPSREEEEERV